MIVFAWIHPDDLRRAGQYVKGRREIRDDDRANNAVYIPLYAVPDEAPINIRSSLVRVQVRADWVGEK